MSTTRRATTCTTDGVVHPSLWSPGSAGQERDSGALEERRLAALVINRARLDFMKYGWEESYDFLTGRSEMSEFWFDAVGLPFFTGTKDELHAKLIKWGEK
jgi:hypothetical protein